MISNFPSWSDFGTHDQSRFPELWDGCVGAWAPCLGPTGSKLHDVSRNNNWGTLTNMDAATDWVVSSGCFAIDFDGTNDFIRANHVLRSASWTVSCWALIRSFAATRTVWSQGTAAAGTFITLRTNTSSQFFFSVDGVSTTVTSASSYVTNQWYHTCLTHSDGVTTLFIDGVQQATQTKADDLTADNFTIGSTPITAGALFLDGQIDDVMVYSRALFAREIGMLRTARGVAYQKQTKRRFFQSNESPAFRAAWARNSNYIISPVGAA